MFQISTTKYGQSILGGIASTLQTAVVICHGVNKD